MNTDSQPTDDLSAGNQSVTSTTGHYRGEAQPLEHDQILILDFGSQTPS